MTGWLLRRQEWRRVVSESGSTARAAGACSPSDQRWIAQTGKCSQEEYFRVRCVCQVEDLVGLQRGRFLQYRRGLSPAPWKAVLRKKSGEVPSTRISMNRSWHAKHMPYRERGSRRLRELGGTRSIRRPGEID